MSNKRLQLVLLMLLFLMPPVVAYVLYYADFRPSSVASSGQLVEPLRPLGDADLETIEGKKFTLSELQSKWTLLYFGGPDCDDVCRQNLYKVHQVRLTQSKNIGRVNSVYITRADTPKDRIAELHQTYPDLVILLAQAETHARLRALMPDGPGATLQSGQQVYIVDPIGNIMMMYKADADPSGMKKDLKRLLKVSQLG